MSNQIEIKIGFHPEQEGLALFMGELEAEVMELIWRQGPLTVKRALFFLSESRKIAYTTIMTVMNRLTEKKLLNRAKEGYSYIYSPTTEKNLFLNFATRQVIGALIDNHPDVYERVSARMRKKKSQKKKSSDRKK